MTAPIRVLHVDDEPDFAETAAVFVEQRDERIEVEPARDAAGALERLAETDYDCVVSDFDMPGRNGIEFLEAVRESHPDLPFILYTGKGSEVVASDAISAGVTEYLQKEHGPGQYDVLANRIRNAVEKHRAQDRLEDREQRLNLFFEQSPLGVIRWDRDFCFARVNDRAREILGYDAGELVGESWEVVVPPEDREIVGERVVGDLLADEGGYHSVNENVRKDGERVVCEWHNWVVTDEDGAVVAVFSQFQDITDRIERERELSELAEYNREIVENAPVGLFRLDEDMRIVYENRRAEEIVGVPEDADGSPALGQDLRDLQSVRGTDAAEALDRLAAGDRVAFDTPFESIFGKESYLTGEGVPLVVDGAFAGAIIMVRDVTERKETERAIEDLHRTADALMQAETRDAVAEITVDAVRDILDMPANGLHLADDDRDLVPAAWTAQTESVVGELPTFAPGEGLAGTAFETGETLTYDDVSTEPDRYNPETDVRSQIVVPLGEHGVLVIGSPEADAFDDVDTSLAETLGTHARTALDRLDRERELRMERDFIEKGLDLLTDIFYVVDPDGSVRRWNERVPAVTGYTDEEIAEMTAWDFFPEAEHERVSAAIGEVLETGQATLECEVRTATGDTVPHEFKGARLTDPEGEPSGIIGIGRDVSARAARERELAAKNERLQEFANLLSHDLRNPLNVAQGRVALAREERDDEHLAAAARAIDRSLALIDDLLTLAREGGEDREVETVDLGEMCAGCWEVVETADATLLNQADVRIRADPGRLKQLLENLMRNAVEHGGESVTVTIEDLPEGFAVTDDGPGIPDGDHESVFEPGYSTATAGTGFGLNIVREIADAHGWDVRVTDGDAGGARFEVTGVEKAT